MVAFLAFIVIHVTLVVLTGFGENMGNMVLGQHDHDQGLAVAIGLAIIATCILIWGLTTWYSRRSPRTVQHALGAIIRPGLRLMSLQLRSRQTYQPKQISPVMIRNGYPPDTDEYRQMVDDNFEDWALEIKGLVDTPPAVDAGRPAWATEAYTDNQTQLHTRMDGNGGVGRGTVERDSRALQAKT